MQAQSRTAALSQPLHGGSVRHGRWHAKDLLAGLQAGTKADSSSQLCSRKQLPDTRAARTPAAAWANRASKARAQHMAQHSMDVTPATHAARHPLSWCQAVLTYDRHVKRNQLFHFYSHHISSITATLMYKGVAARSQ